MTISVLILAGSRPDACDICEQTGADTKALVSLKGVRMIDYVIRAVRDAPGLEGCDIWLSGLSVEAFETAVPGDLRDLAGRIKQAPFVDAGPAAAMLAALDTGQMGEQVLVTTADHPLLNPDMIAAFLTGAECEDCDFAVGLADRKVIEAGYPSVRRTYLKFAGEGYSGCNLFLVRTPEGRRAAEFWRQVGHHRKKPLKLMQCIGYRTLVRMLTGRLCLDGAFQRGSAKIGASVSPILIPFAEAAIDVDKMSDLDLVRSIMDACLHERELQYN